MFYSADVKCVILKSAKGNLLVKTFLHNIINVTILGKIRGRCKKDVNYKIVERKRLRINRICGAKFKVCHEFGQKKTTEAAETTTVATTTHAKPGILFSFVLTVLL